MLPEAEHAPSDLSSELSAQSYGGRVRGMLAGRGAEGCADPFLLSPGHVPPVASNHPFLPRIHLPLPGGTAGEHGHPIRPWGSSICMELGRRDGKFVEHTAGLGTASGNVSRGSASCLAPPRATSPIPPALPPRVRPTAAWRPWSSQPRTTTSASTACVTELPSPRQRHTRGPWLPLPHWMRWCYTGAHYPPALHCSLARPRRD